MFAEAGAAAAVVAAQLDANAALVGSIADRLRARPPRAVITLARGSSDHAATFARYLVETRVGVLTASAAPSVASVYGTRVARDDVLALVVSQSGRSPDLLAAARAAGAAGAHTLALVNVADSPLAALADTVLPLRAGAEHSVAATKSFIATLAALVQLTAAWSADAALAAALAALPAALARAWDADWTPLVDGLADARGLYVIGRGVGLGIAQEAALKFKETCGLHAEAFSAAEVRHGPLALVGPGFPLLVFAQADATAGGTADLVAEVVARGGTVYVAGADIAGAVTLPVVAAHAATAPVLQIQSFYRAVNALAVRRGFDPDRPPHLRKVTETV